MAGSWTETEEILGDVEALARDSEEAEAAQRCRSMATDLEEVYARAEQRAANVVRDFATEVAEARRKAEEFAAQTPTSPEIEALEQDRAALERKIAEIGAEKSGVEELLAELEERLVEMEEQIASAKHQDVDVLPVIKHALSLYSSATKIKWHFDLCEGSVIAGSMIDADVGVAREFQFDESELTKFQLANKLWDVLICS